MLGTETVGNRCPSVLRKTAEDEDRGEINSPAPGNLENYRHYWFTASLRGSLAARQRWHSVRCDPPSKERLWLPESVVKTHIRASWNGQKSSLYIDPDSSRAPRGRAGSKTLWHGSRLHRTTFYWALQNHKKIPLKWFRNPGADYSDKPRWDKLWYHQKGCKALSHKGEGWEGCELYLSGPVVKQLTASAQLAVSSLWAAPLIAPLCEGALVTFYRRRGEESKAACCQQKRCHSLWVTI